MKNITLTFLGTGTSHGVPMIGCSCPVCKSDNPKNKRLNASVLITVNSKNILIDCGRDFREQALKHNITNIDHVILTHDHHDHTGGIDDLRAFNKTIPIYGYIKHLENIKKYSYKYLFDGNVQKGGGLTKPDLIPVKDSFVLEDIRFDIIPVKHGELLCYGYKFESVAYISDVSFIPGKSMDKLKDVDILILDALRLKEHKTHFNLSLALKTAELINPRKTYFTHICHDLDHEKTKEMLKDPDSEYFRELDIELACDGLIITI